jgi:hypothetical protein
VLGALVAALLYHVIFIAPEARSEEGLEPSGS